MSLRIHFQQRLEEVRADVLRMGGEANEMVRQAIEATVSNDIDLIARVKSMDDRIDDGEKEALQKVVLVVMQEAPVADDLRFLLATLGVVSEIEKVGDHAVKLVRRAGRLGGTFPVEMRRPLIELGELARKEFARSLRLYAEYSPELAREVILADEEVDKAYSRARHQVYDLIKANPEATERLIRTMECFHALEHVSDQSVAIANRMVLLYEP